MIISCDYCAKQIPKASHGQRFCSDKCRWLSWRDRKALSCFYCGCPADSIDHIPPRAARPYLDPKRYPQTEVRACRECNSLLGYRGIFTPDRRKRFIKRALRIRYRNDLREFLWTPAEIEGLGPTLRTAVESRKFRHELIKDRLAW